MQYIWDVSAGLPHVVYLTKLDKVCPLVDQDVRKIYYSEACKQALEIAADVIGIPRGHVFPVKNYEQETQLQTNVSILALTAMRQTLVFADDYLEDQYELQSDQQNLNKLANYDKIYDISSKLT